MRFNLAALAMVGLSGTAAAAPTNLSNNEALNVLTRYFLPSYGDGDHVTSIRRAELGSTCCSDGAAWYIPAYSSSTLQPVYRHLNQSLSAHRDSLLNPEASGYQFEGPQGFTYSTGGAGLCQINRWFRSSINDMMTGFCGEVPPSTYTQSGTLGYGWPRYGTACEVPLQLVGNSVTIAANLAAGGAISQLHWNGKQFINNFDYGRQIQTAFNLSPILEEDNPTEAGDKYGCPGIVPNGWGHGSPLVLQSIQQKTLSTAVHPLQWKPEAFGGGSDRPVRWKGTIGKTVKLDQFSDSKIIDWSVQVSFPMAQSQVNMEILTAYLNSEFNRFWVINGQTNSLTEVTGSIPTGDCVKISNIPGVTTPSKGGVVISTADSLYALGIYRNATDNGFGLCKFSGGGGTTGSGTSKWNVLQRPIQSALAGEVKSYNVKVVVGTVADVRAAMQMLAMQ